MSPFMSVMGLDMIGLLCSDVIAEKTGVLREEGRSDAVPVPESYGAVETWRE